MLKVLAIEQLFINHIIINYVGMPDVVEGGSGCRVTTQDPPPRDPDQRIPRSSEGSCLPRPRRPRATVGPPPPPVAAAAAGDFI